MIYKRENRISGDASEIRSRARDPGVLVKSSALCDCTSKGLPHGECQPKRNVTRVTSREPDMCGATHSIAEALAQQDSLRKSRRTGRTGDATTEVRLARPAR